MTRDLRRYAKQTNIRLIIGGMAILVIIGDAAVMGLLCLMVGLLPLLVIWAILFFFEWVVKKSNAD